jgi:hypothetical protein
MLASAAVRADDKALIEKVKTTWRAQDGETADQIIGKAAKVAHFISRGWEVDKAGGQEVVTFSWVKHSDDKTDDEYTINWEVAADGTMTLGPPYAKPMELGWQPFALSLIASDVSEEEKDPNLRFLHDLSNFNFVTTAQGKLGDLLKRGRCTITDDPVNVIYLPPDTEKPENGDFWHVQLQVNCDVPGPTYFTRGGVVLFDKRTHGDWRQASMFAKRIDSYPPGTWFDRADPNEKAVFDTARKVFRERGLLGNE